MNAINTVNTHIMPCAFEYYAPKGLDEVVALLDKYGDSARILAGGTDLTIRMKQGVEPAHIVNIKNVKELSHIEDRIDGVHIGASTRMIDIETSDVVKELFPSLREAAEAVGSIQVRNMATIGGNLCNASPAADTAPPLIALNAKACIIGLRRSREVPLEEFFVGPGRTILERGELLADVIIAYPKKNTGNAFLRIARTSMDIAKINIAVAAQFQSHKIDECRIALGAVAPKPIRIPRAEEFLNGRELTDEVLRKAGEIVSEDIRPITDVRSTVDYRRSISKVLMKDALLTARQRSKQMEMENANRTDFKRYS